MKPHPRIRKAIKWGGAAVTVLLVVVWGVGLWGWPMGWCRGIACLSAGNGHIEVASDSVGDDYFTELAARQMSAASFGRISLAWVPSRRGWKDRLSGLTWMPRLETFPAFPGMPATWQLRVPLWIPFACFGIPTALCWRSDRRRVHLCPKCNYDRAGLAAGAVCPECGAGARS